MSCGAGIYLSPRGSASRLSPSPLGFVLNGIGLPVRGFGGSEPGTDAGGSSTRSGGGLPAGSSSSPSSGEAARRFAGRSWGERDGERGRLPGDTLDAVIRDGTRVVHRQLQVRPVYPERYTLIQRPPPAVSRHLSIRLLAPALYLGLETLNSSFSHRVRLRRSPPPPREEPGLFSVLRLLNVVVFPARPGCPKLDS